jgi:Protein of unknown function (DUF642)
MSASERAVPTAKSGRSLAVACLLLAGLVWAAPSSAEIGLVGWSGPSYSGVDNNFGFEFDTSATIYVNELGYYDRFLDGLAAAHGVAIWRLSDQALMVSATVPAGTASELDGEYRYVAVPQTELAPGRYIVSAVTTGDSWLTNIVAPVMSGPLTYIRGTSHFPAETASLVYPNQAGGNQTAPANFAYSLEPSIVTNGSFEIGADPGSFTILPQYDPSIDGWLNLYDDIAYIGSYWPASDGSRSVDLKYSAITQTIPTEVGVEYMLEFDLAGIAGPTPVKRLRVYTISGPVTEQHTYYFDAHFSNQSDLGWIPRAFPFLAGSTSTDLYFSSEVPTGDGAVIDNVRVYPMPRVAQPADADRDGVPDATDHCPADPKPWLPVASALLDPVSNGLPAGTGAWSRHDIVMSRGVIPSPNPSYKTCNSFKTEHLQDIAAIDTAPDFDGRMEYAASHSQDRHGHMMVFGTDLGTPGVTGQQDPPDEDRVLDGSVGEGVWYRLLDGASEEGPYNHPGDLALVGQTLIVAAQNWDGGEGVFGQCAGEIEIDRTARRFQVWNAVFGIPGCPSPPCRIGFGEPDAILFYDVSTPASPRYLGKIFLASLPAHPDFGIFEWGRFTGLSASRYGEFVYMNVDGRNYRSDSMSWRADDWTPIPASELPLSLNRSVIQVQTAAGQTSYSMNLADDDGYCPYYDSFDELSFGYCLPVDTEEAEGDLFATRSGKAAFVSADGGFGVPGAGTGEALIRFHQVSSVNSGPVSWPLTPPPEPPTPTNGSAACEPVDFSELDLAAPGDGLVTLDPVSALEWLDLTQTVGTSVADALDPAGLWVSQGWRLATKLEVCELFERAGVALESTAGVDCASLVGGASPVEAAVPYPARFEGLLSKLGFTKQTAARRDQAPNGSGQHQIAGGDFSCNPIDCDKFFWTIDSQLDRGNGYGARGWSFEACGPDAEEGWCAAEAFYDASSTPGVVVPQVGSLSRGLIKCEQADLRTCMDGIITGTSIGNASVCKKCGILDDDDFCPAVGCAEDQSFPEVATFLVRPAPEPGTSLLIGGGALWLAMLGRRRAQSRIR